MATYKEIQEYIKNKYKVTIKTCWIADVKEKYNLITRNAPNRISQSKRMHPCPIKHLAKIEEAFRHFKMI